MPTGREVMNQTDKEGVKHDEFIPPFIATNLVENKSIILSNETCLLKDKYSNWQEVKCLLDVGSQVCLMSNECLQ